MCMHVYMYEYMPTGIYVYMYIDAFDMHLHTDTLQNVPIYGSVYASDMIQTHSLDTSTVHRGIAPTMKASCGKTCSAPGRRRTVCGVRRYSKGPRLG